MAGYSADLLIAWKHTNIFSIHIQHA
jgi:hypothetical protein